jgi:hypothetical protein
MKELTLINRYHQTQERPKPPVEQRVKVMDTLDKKMQTILEREDLSEDERLKLYDQSFTRYLNVYDDHRPRPMADAPKPVKQDLIDNEISMTFTRCSTGGFGHSWVWWYLFIKVSSFIETMQRATVLLQMQSVLVGIPKNPPFCKIAFFFLRETDFFVSALNPALFLLSFSFCSLVNGTLPLKNYRHTHTDSRRDCDRLWLCA